MKLPADVCRCHDDDCPQKETCLRWLARHDCGHPRINHAASLWDEMDRDCKHYAECYEPKETPCEP